ncbi:MAG: hypothetical protein GY940_31675, partial [bacterium]|nr:hypothetical protein [bacterium]
NYYNYSVLFPTTFYNLTAQEIGSRGYANYLAFYDYLIKLRFRFVRFWIDMVYYHDPGSAVRNFVQKGENLFQLQPRPPGNFNIGVLISFLWSLFLFTGTYVILRRKRHRLNSKDIETLNKAEVDLEPVKGKITCLCINGLMLGHLLYQLFSGNFRQLAKLGFVGKVVLNGIDITKEKSNLRFFYFPRPDQIPDDLKVRHLIYYVARIYKIPEERIIEVLNRPEIKAIASKTFGQLRPREEDEKRREKQVQRFEALLALADVTDADVYLFNDVACDYPVECSIKLKDRMDGLATDAAVVYLVGSDNKANFRIKDARPFIDGSHWFDWVESERRRVN